MSRSFKGERAMIRVNVENEDTGGGFTATLMTLEDGRVLVASTVDPVVCLHKDLAAWEARHGWPERIWNDLPSAFAELLCESPSDQCETCNGVGLHREDCPEVRIVPTLKGRGSMLG